MLRLECERLLGEFLTGARLEHVHRVAETCVALARVWGVDEDVAYLGGLLHDVAKPLTPETLAAKGVDIAEESRVLYDTYPRVWHAFAAQDVLRAFFPVLPDRVYSEIQWHTTGTAAMSLLARIVFVADFIEPKREAHGVPEVRELAFRDLNLAVYGLSLCSIRKLLLSGDRIHPETFRCQDYYLTQILASEARKIGVRLVG